MSLSNINMGKIDRVVAAYIVKNSITRVGRRVLDMSIGSLMRELGRVLRGVVVVDDGDDGSGGYM